MPQPQPTRISLKKAKDRAVRNLHPWIFSGALGRIPPEVASGDLVDVLSYEGEFMGRGFYGTSSIAVRLLTFEEEEIDRVFWEKRLVAAMQLRQQLGFPSGHTNAFRWVHGEGDGLPGLVLDVYDDTVVFQAHHIGMWRQREEIASVIKKIGGGRFRCIFDKSAESLPGEKDMQQDFLHGDLTGGAIHENGHAFRVNWQEGQKTGFFLDQRDNRQLLGNYVKDKHVLNAYAYSGGFSVYAGKAGAASVHSVDSSAKAIEWAEANMELNGLAGIHQGIVADVTDFLKKPAAPYDVVVLDPPAFAKRLSVLEQGLRGYRHINSMAIRHIQPNGILFTFSCSQAVSHEQFQQIIFQAAAESRRFVRILHRLHQPPDHPVSIYHPEGAYLKGLVLHVA